MAILDMHTDLPISRRQFLAVAAAMSAGTWTEAATEGHVIACFDLEKGTTTLSA